jgi:hypothetical protein
MFTFSKDTLLNNCVTPLLITWTDINGVIQEKKLKVSSTDKRFTTTDNSVVINLIPMNSKVLYIPVEDKIDFNLMTEEEKNTLRAVLYYNTDSPMDVSIDLGTIEIIYFMNDFKYPESQKMLVTVT